MKKRIKIGFSDLWSGFNYNPNISNIGDNTLYTILSERWDVEISYTPDILIYSVFGNNHQRFNGTKIFFTAENKRPNYNECDYSISFDYIDDDRNFRFPLSAITLYESGYTQNFKKEIDFDVVKREKTKFCNFVFSNPGAHLRNQLFFELSKYKLVDAGGRVYNNIGGPVGDKLSFINNYKFTIAFENSEYPGYTTEKLVHPKLKNSIPIYWGNPKVGEDWNTKAFINAYEFDNMNQMIEYIKEVDNNDDLYFKILSEPHFTNVDLPFNFQYNNLLDFFENIFKNKNLI